MPGAAIPPAYRPGLVIARAQACANIALIKYWGKRDAALNLPAASSLSLTLEGLLTDTTVAFEPRSLDVGQDVIRLDGELAQGPERDRIAAFLDRVRQLAPGAGRAQVESANNFPRAAGLASSASGFAALALAATKAAGLALSPAELSVLARLGSGSACRSVFGGFVQWQAGQAADGHDSHAIQILAPEAWDVRMLVAIVADRPKPRASRDAMNHTVATSLYFDAWQASIPRDIEVARQAIADRDLATLGEIAESNALRMHSTMFGARPPIVYWLPETLAAMHRVWELRDAGLACWFTIDAGPNVKVLCDPGSEPAVSAALEALPGVLRIVAGRPGPGVQERPVTWRFGEAKADSRSVADQGARHLA